MGPMVGDIGEEVNCVQGSRCLSFYGFPCLSRKKEAQGETFVDRQCGRATSQWGMKPTSGILPNPETDRA
ncbi:hypothetical protein [Laceyella putida]|uniref:Uncharacterized protein n=1 Tax=Laceyella putida TaxID=110101 RepID=A0ABW2RG45_9BACL